MRIFFAILYCISSIHVSSQTLGLLKIGPDVQEGYTLFSPIFSKNTYLINNCGHKVHQWDTPYQPGQTAYLRSDGSLVRTARISGSFTGGGVGGRVEIYDWNGILIWHSNFANESVHQHHSVLPMPNGNLLIILWIKYDKDQAIEHGFKLGKLTNAGIWSDKIIEIKPKGTNEYDLIWEWDFWDHAIQDIDSTKNNYGIVANHPELLDMNFSEDPGANSAEWIHLNSVDYDPDNDWILLSSKFHNEIYIIDHSTTIEEAKGHKGGKYGKGGDFLFRWGNPRSYARGTREDHVLFGQHDVQFLPKTQDNEHPILIYNNGSNRLDSLYSTVLEIRPKTNPDSSFVFEQDGRYYPAKEDWIYPDKPDKNFYSSRISGVQRLSNGNTLICEGNKGLFTEINSQKKIVWQYRNPVNNLGPSQQGQPIFNNDVFNIRKYRKDFPAFLDKELDGLPIETGTNPSFCEQLLSSDNVTKLQSIRPYPNPVFDNLYIDSVLPLDGNYTIKNMLNIEVLSGRITNNDNISFHSLNAGMYFLQIISKDFKNSPIFTIIKI